MIGNVPKPLADNVLTLLGLTAAASATDAAIHKKRFASGTRPLDLAKQTTLIISNEEINDIMRIIKSLEKPGLAKQLRMKQKYKKEHFSKFY